MDLSIFVFGNLKLELTITVAKGVRVDKSSKFERQLREEDGLLLCVYVRHYRSIRRYSSLWQSRLPVGSVCSKTPLVPPFIISPATSLDSIKQGRDDAHSTRSHSVWKFNTDKEGCIGQKAWALNVQGNGLEMWHSWSPDHILLTNRRLFRISFIPRRAGFWRQCIEK